MKPIITIDSYLYTIYPYKNLCFSLCQNLSRYVSPYAVGRFQILIAGLKFKRSMWLVLWLSFNKHTSLFNLVHILWISSINFNHVYYHCQEENQSYKQNNASQEKTINLLDTLSVDSNNSSPKRNSRRLRSINFSTELLDSDITWLIGEGWEETLKKFLILAIFMRAECPKRITPEQNSPS